MYRKMGAAALSLALLAGTGVRLFAQSRSLETFPLIPDPGQSQGPVSITTPQPARAPSVAVAAHAPETLPEPVPARPAETPSPLAAQPGPTPPAAPPVGPMPLPGPAVPGGVLPEGTLPWGVQPGTVLPGPLPGPGPLPPPGLVGPGGPAPLELGAVIGVREKGCYHTVVQYYSPYQVRPLVPPEVAGANVRSALAKLGIPVLPQPIEKEADKEKGKEKDKEKEKEPIRDK